MKRVRVVAISVIVALVAWLPLAAQSAPKRPLSLDDILAFKALTSLEVSPNGQVVAYRMAPIQGDSDVIVRATGNEADHKYAVGAGNGPVAFSEDSAWIGLTVTATRRQAQAAQRTNQPVDNSVTLVNLATFEPTAVPKIRRFAFNGELGGWVALHRAPAEAGGGAAAAGRGAPAGGRGGGGRGGAAAANPDAPRDTRPKGTDLILRDLKTGTELNIGNVSEFAFDKSGRHLALVIDAADQAGNGVQIRDMVSGAVTPLDTDKAFYERLAWTEQGDALVVLKGKDDRNWKERLYSVVGFTGVAGPGAPVKVTYDPASDSAFPKTMTISGNRAPQWTESRDAILFGIADLRKVDRPAGPAGRGAAASEGADTQTPAPAAGAADERPNLVIWHYKDPRLQSMQQVQESRDQQFSYLASYRVADAKFVRLADEKVRDVTAPARGQWAIGSDNSAYELEGNLDGREYRDIYAVDLHTGQKKLLKAQVRWGDSQSPDGTKYLFYENRQYQVIDVASGEIHSISPPATTVSFVDTEDDHNIVDPPIRPLGWTSDSAAVLLSDNWDIWKVPVAAGGTAVNLTVNGKRDSIRYGPRVTIDRHENGADLSRPQYFAAQGAWTKQGGYAELIPGQPGVTMLLWGDAIFSRLQKAEKADVWFYSRETPTEAGDLYVTDAQLGHGRRLTNIGVEAEPFLWTSGVQLIDYKNDKGEHLQGSLYLPAGYQKGKQYPMVVEIYERETQGNFGFGRPTANGFSRQAYTSNGYAVLMPDIKYYVNDPGMSAVWALVPAVKAAIATGVVDPKRVGLHGHSWGGYQTAFTITQTDVFAAAVAGAPLTDMISMYSIIYKNSGGTNGAIFESSQGRFTSGPWDNWAAYTRNSPVAQAKGVHTPLMILSNDADGAVDFTQGIEYYDTLRRLGKPVILLEYPGENHSLARPANQQDYTIRMQAFFDHYLKGTPSPDWLENGVPRLQMPAHIDEMIKARQDQQKAAPAPGPGGSGGGGGGGD